MGHSGPNGLDRETKINCVILAIWETLPLSAKILKKHLEIANESYTHSVGGPSADTVPRDRGNPKSTEVCLRWSWR